jgi:tartrate-resistant acid phosphatase type 5
VTLGTKPSVRSLFLGCLLFAFASAGTGQTVRFAVIGDYGADTTAEGDVARLVKSWEPDFILTVGDNNYDSGSAATIDANIGKYYHEYIYRYAGAYGIGASTRRFLPVLGNHDWGDQFPDPVGAAPYLAYFDLPGNERYYSWNAGSVEFFALDSDANEPDGNTSASAQALWLRSALASSTAAWKIVYFHHPAYSSAEHGSSLWMRWPFAAWGASAVLAGHDHDYERLNVAGLPYFVNGLGGKSIYAFVNVLPESQFRYNADYGAMLVTAGAAALTFEFYNRAGLRVDSYVLRSARRPVTVPWRSGS